MDFTFRMYATVLFDRPIDREKDYIVPGGYVMMMNGTTVQFDFEDYEGIIDPKHPRLLHFMQKNPDYNVFPDLLTLTPNSFKRVEKIEDFYIYTGEDGESDIVPLKVTSLEFEIIPKVGKIYGITCRKVIPYTFPV